MSGGIVYVVQMVHKWDDKKQEFVQKFDVGPATKFGPVEYLLSPRANPFNPDSIIGELKEKLKYFGDDDWLLLMGNPCLIGWAVAAAAAANDGRVRLLQWNQPTKAYIEIVSNLNQKGR